jgi:alpha-beta hydrolase superfamily lysophospholipase
VIHIRLYSPADPESSDTILIVVHGIQEEINEVERFLHHFDQNGRKFQNIHSATNPTQIVLHAQIQWRWNI